MNKKRWPVIAGRRRRRAAKEKFLPDFRAYNP
jgi:hypothetical protein